MSAYADLAQWQASGIGSPEVFFSRIPVPTEALLAALAEVDTVYIGDQPIPTLAQLMSAVRDLAESGQHPDLRTDIGDGRPVSYLDALCLSTGPGGFAFEYCLPIELSVGIDRLRLEMVDGDLRCRRLGLESVSIGHRLVANFDSLSFALWAFSPFEARYLAAGLRAEPDDELRNSVLMSAGGLVESPSLLHALRLCRPHAAVNLLALLA